MTGVERDSSPPDEEHPQEVEFVIVNTDADFGRRELKGSRNTGTLIDLNQSGTGLLTPVPLQPGDMVQLDHAGTSKVGLVMWSVESSNKFRVQMRFV